MILIITKENLQLILEKNMIKVERIIFLQEVNYIMELVLKKCRKVFALVLASTLIASLAFGVTENQAIAKAKLKTKKVTLKVGQKKQIVVKNKKKKAKYLFKSNKPKVASVSTKGKIKAIKEGKAVITVKEKRNKSKASKQIGKVTVVVQKKEQIKEKKNAEASQMPATSTEPPKSSVAPQTQTPAANTTSSPEPTAVPTEKVFDETDFTTPDGFDQAVSGRQYGEMNTISYYSTTTETTRKANILLPLNYSTDKKYPVLYLLHGIGGDHNEWNGANPKYVIGNLVAEGKAKDMIVVMPNVRARANDGMPSDMLSLDNFHAFDNFINDLRDNLMPYIKENYSILEGRENTAIAGLSMGGRESLYIGLTMQDTFGYIGAFSPAIGIFAYTGNVSEPGLFKKEDFKLQDQYNGNTLLLICNGDNDTTVYDNPQQYHNALTENGTKHIFYLTEGGHDFRVWKHGLYNFVRRIF